jgi:hypothetical protein
LNESKINCRFVKATNRNLKTNKVENFRLDNQSLTFKVIYNQMEVSQNNILLHTIKGMSIIPIHVKISPLEIKENFIQKKSNNLEIQNELYQGIYYTNIIDYTLGEISLAANFLTDFWIKNIWELLNEENENCLTISLTDEAIKEQIALANPHLFYESSEIDIFCATYNITIQDFVQIGKFEQLEIDLEGISARLSSEIVFFRKKLFTELLIEKIDAKIFDYEEQKRIILPINKKKIYTDWRTSQLKEIELVQKYVESPFTFDDLEQFSNYKTSNNFAVKSLEQLDLISETSYWMEYFPKAKSRFEIAIKYYQDGGDLRDSVDNLRLSLELLLKELLGNEKSLENQTSIISEYQELHGIGKQIRNTFQKVLEYYTRFQNDRVKHDVDLNNVHEVEFIFGLTMIFIRMLVKSNSKYNLQ